MKLCTKHQSAINSSLASRGMSTDQHREDGMPHTDGSAVRQVILSKGYARFCFRVHREDMCPLCALSLEDEAMQWVSDAVDEVGRRRGL